MALDAASPSHFDLYDPYDYCRGRALELVRKQIGDLPESVAECWFFLGDFARLINHCFPDRKLFLYDTFEGHDEGEAAQALRDGYYCDFTEEKLRDSVEQVYKNGSRQAFNLPEDASSSQVADCVVARMPFPEKCIPRVGLFPDTAALDGEEKFVFVSLDINFRESMRSGLELFYPRLHDVGVIFAHDYNSPYFFGVRKAVEETEENLGSFKKFPLPDSAGTLVIVK
jgi:hypothetical protein